MTVEEHTAIVKELNEELKKGARAEGKLRVLVTGILADSPSLLKIFDDNGIQVAFDDVANESRQYRTDVPEMKNPMDALAHKFADMDNCTLLYDREKKRVDYIPIKRACDKAGLMHLNIEVDRQMVNYEQAGTMIQAFKEMCSFK